MCLFLNIESGRSNELLDNFVVESKLSGHNNEISIISFYNTKKVLLGKACLKYSLEQRDKLQLESTILSVLKSNNIVCPVVIDSVLDTIDSPSILMEVVSGTLASDLLLNPLTAESVLDTIQAHESILKDNLGALQAVNEVIDLEKEIDFEKKLIDYFEKFAPHFKIMSSFNFFNNYLNDFNIIKRSIVTDRSADNIFIGENNKIIMIDFSTLRIGTQFDNWIQFIDDPRVKFSCSKEELKKLFFRKNNLPKSILDFYYVASVYTNLLQGIFTYKKNPELSMQYINNANDAFEKFNKKKGVLIDISH